MKRFVILAAPRTGSNLLCTLLQSHPDVLCHHEIFNPSDIFVSLPLRDTDFTLGSMADRNANPLHFLQGVWENGLGHQSVGFKMTHQQQVQVFNAVCSDPDIHKIVLKRKARLKTYVSRLLADRSGIWEDYQGQDCLAQPQPVEVNYQKLKAAVDFNEHYYTNLDSLICGQRTDVCYENLFDNDTQERLLKELKLCSYPLQSQARQQNPHTPWELIINRESLAQQLKHHPTDRELLLELNQPLTV